MTGQRSKFRTSNGQQVIVALRACPALGRATRCILLGSDDFADKLKPLLSDYAALREVPRRERLTTRPSLAKLFSKVPDKQTRNEWIHDALRVHGYTLQEVGDAVGLHYSTVSRIAKRVAEVRVTTEKSRLRR